MKSPGKLTGFVFPECPNRKIKTARLAFLVSSAQAYMFQHANDTPEEVKVGIKSIITGVEVKPETRKFCEYMKEFITGKGQSTGDIYRVTLERIKRYDPGCTFETIDKHWLEAYQGHEANRGRKANGIAIDLRNIRAVFNWAIDNEYTNLYPFRKFSIKTERNKYLFLPAEQMMVIRDYPVEKYQEPYRDLFMLGFYLLGMNISDLLELRPSDLRFGRIVYHRNKTHRLYDIKVEPEAMTIIKKYKGKEHLLRFLDKGNVRTIAHNTNAALKRIGKVEVVKNKRGANIKKLITPLFPDIVWYTARRSWATIAASLDIPKEVIGKALGHSEWDSTTTDIYINFDNKKIDEANRKVLDYLKEQ